MTLNIGVYDETDENHHVASADPLWHESHLTCWYDPKNGIGAFYFLNHYVNQRRGHVTFHVVTKDGLRFRHSAGHQLGPDDQKVGFALNGRHRIWWDEGHLHVAANETECQMRLQFSDFHPRFHYWDVIMGGRSDGGGLAGDHFETAGRVKGTVVLGGASIEIDSFYYRDRSWGPRKQGMLRSSRWFVGTFGPDLSFCICEYLANPQSASEKSAIHRHGYVVHNGVPENTTDFDLLPFVEADSWSLRGGVVDMTLHDGTVIHITQQVVEGAILNSDPLQMTFEGLGIAKWGNRTGFVNFQTTQNARYGSERPLVLLRSTLEEGLSRSEHGRPTRIAINPK